MLSEIILDFRVKTVELLLKQWKKCLVKNSCRQILNVLMTDLFISSITFVD